MNISFTCPADACYTNRLCDIEKKGRVIALALIKKSAAALVDKSSSTAWLDSIWSLLLNGDAVLINNISGEKPRPETAELAGRGMQINKMGAKTHTLNLFDMQIVGAVDFYNKILRSAAKFDLYYFTPDLIWDVSGNQVTINGDPVIQNDLTNYISGEVTVKWVQDGNPLPSDFDTDTLLEGLYLEVSGLTEITATGTTSYSAVLNQPLPSGSLPAIVWSATGSPETLENVGFAMDPITGELEILSIEVGSWPLTITAGFATDPGQSPSCVIGELEVTVSFAGV